MKIGFVGLGIMGRPMALNLKNGGHELFVPERASLTDEIRAASTVLGDATAVAAASDVVILMVPDTPDVETVLFGAGGVAEGLKPGTLVIDMSSISPTATKEFAAKIAADPDHLNPHAGSLPLHVGTAVVGGLAIADTTHETADQCARAALARFPQFH